jgi:hypothetical protein
MAYGDQIRLKRAAAAPKVVVDPNPTTNDSRKRTRTSDQQLILLLQAFTLEALPCVAYREALSLLIGLSNRSIQIWFQNRRQKLKLAGNKENNSRILAKRTVVLQALNKVFSTTRTPSAQDLEQLSDTTEIHPKNISIWFQIKAQVLMNESALVKPERAQQGALPPQILQNLLAMNRILMGRLQGSSVPETIFPSVPALSLEQRQSLDSAILQQDRFIRATSGDLTSIPSSPPSPVVRMKRSHSQGSATSITSACSSESSSLSANPSSMSFLMPTLADQSAIFNADRMTFAEFAFPLLGEEEEEEEEYSQQAMPAFGDLAHAFQYSNDAYFPPNPYTEDVSPASAVSFWNGSGDGSSLDPSEESIGVPIPEPESPSSTDFSEWLHF